MAKMKAKEKKSEKKSLVGGQAVIEGVMMKRNDNVAIAVRKPNRKISIKKEKFGSASKKIKFLGWPIIRGCVNFIEMTYLGMSALTHSANESLDEKDEKLSPKEMIITIVMALLLGIGLFVLLPLFLTSLIKNISGVLFNLVDGLIRVALVMAYILGISFMRDVRRLFEYHGAEHKAVNCHENNEELTVKNVKKYSTLNARCGTSFIFYVLIVSIIVFSLVPSNRFIIKLASRIVLLPLIAGISYEILKFSAAHSKNVFLKILISPGFLMQKITTREPNEKQIEVAIAAIKAVL
jgi:uncharacterized protein YqhQ